MREHWVSTTRKLNKHYQSVGSPILFKWDPTQVNKDHAIAYGVDELLLGLYPLGTITSPMPRAMQYISQFEFVPFITREGSTSGDVYVSYLQILVTTEDAQGNTSNHYVNWACPNSNPTPSGTLIPYTSMHEVPFTNLYNNAGLAPLYGEPFVYNATEDRYRLTSRFIIRRSDFPGAVKFTLFRVNTGVMQSERLSSSQKVYLNAEIRKVI